MMMIVHSIFGYDLLTSLEELGQAVRSSGPHSASAKVLPVMWMQRRWLLYRVLICSEGLGIPSVLVFVHTAHIITSLWAGASVKRNSSFPRFKVT